MKLIVSNVSPKALSKISKIYGQVKATSIRNPKKPIWFCVMEAVPSGQEMILHNIRGRVGQAGECFDFSIVSADDVKNIEFMRNHFNC